MGSLIAVNLPDGRLIEYVTDGKGRRIGKMVNGVLTKQWLYRDQLKPVAELDGAGNLVSEFIYGPKSNVPAVVSRSGALYRIITDKLGSPVLAINTVNSNDLPFQLTYTAYGEQTLASGNDGWIPFGFASGQYDPDTKLTRFGARDYDATIGRWVSRDPSRFGERQTNLYVYAKDDPVNYKDSAGRAPASYGDCIKDAWDNLRSCYDGCSGGILGAICSLFSDDARLNCQAKCDAERVWQEDACDLVLPSNSNRVPNDDSDPSDPEPAPCWDWDCYASK
jgi:RHS repeat-associated protein